MNNLYILKNNNASAIQRALQNLSTDNSDTVLFCQEACYAILNLPETSYIEYTKNNYALLVLQDDLKARGLPLDLPLPFKLIDYHQFVELTIQYKRIINL